MSDKQSNKQSDTQSEKQPQNQNLRLLVTLMDDYTMVKEKVDQYQKDGFTYSADGKQFNFDRIKKNLIIVKNPKTTKGTAINFLNSTIYKKRHEILKTNSRGERDKKEIILDIYNDIVNLFAPLFSDNKQPDEKTDEQPDTADSKKKKRKKKKKKKKKEKKKKKKKKKKSAKGLKILTPDQMFSRSPISLAQSKARNNSEKLKIEIRQLLYSLYRSKILTKTVNNHLIDTI